MIRSLRTRLLVGVLLAVACLLTLFGLGVYESFRRALLAEFDQSLLSTARTLMAAIETEGKKTELELDLKKLPQFAPGQEDAYFQAWLTDGKSLIRSPSLGSGDLPIIHAGSGEAIFENIVLPSGRPGRAVALADESRLGGQRRPAPKKKPLPMITLVLAQGTAAMQARLALLAVLLSAGGGATLAAAMAVMLIVVRRGLAPLNTIAHEISAVTSDDLTYRISAAGMPAEMTPVAHKLNDLLSRLEDAFKRERGFTSDVAHELRTPLAGMLATLEVTLSRSRTGKDYVQAMEDCMTIAAQMQAMVESLLMLARLSSGSLALQRQEVDLAGVADNCWKLLSAPADAAPPVFENRLGELRCIADADCMGMVFTNLLNNAITYNRPGGRVWTDALAENGHVHISVSNTGCTLPAEAAEQVFVPFWRGDQSRAMTGVHAGLGLSLVQRSIEAQGGSVKAIINEDDGIFTIRMTLPGGEQQALDPRP
ncbi:MAG: ATP-binding protein [Planctomycetaceae bacterium]|nr:sensor histidine kinase N-terminal domain-containing protein [Planctomycetaceae bacterium]